MNSTDPRSTIWSPCASTVANLMKLIPLVYAIPSLLLYAYVITVLFCRLSGPFYRVFAVGGIMDVLLWVLNFFVNRGLGFPIMFPIYDVFPASGFWPTFLYFAYYYASFAPYAASLFLTLNRFMAAFSNNFKTPFQGSSWVFCSVIVAFPLPLTWYIWWSEVKLRPLNPAERCDGYVWNDTVRAFGIRKSFVLFVVSSLVGTLILAMNIAIASRLFLRRQYLQSSSPQMQLPAIADTRDTELKLFLLTIIIFMYTVVTGFTQTIWYVKDKSLTLEQMYILFAIQHYGQDLHVCSAPWFLLLMSAAVRAEFLRTLSFLGIKTDSSTELFHSRSESAAIPRH